MKLFIILYLQFQVICLFYCNVNAQNVTIALGTGFGFEQKNIEWLPTDFLPLINNRKIEYIKAVQLVIGKRFDKHIEIGGDFSYTWANLNWIPPHNIFDSSINNIGWTSVGGWGKYILLPHKRLQFAIVASAGAHIGYPKRMNVDTIERQVAFYAGLHGGPQYKISDKFMVSYYYGRGKFRNMLLLTYSL